MTRSIPIINGVPNPFVGMTAIADFSGQTVMVTSIIRYNGSGRFTCGFVDTGFIRSTPATYIPENTGPNAFFVKTAGPNVLRQPNFIQGAFQPILIEPFPVTNYIKWSRDLTNAVWILEQGTLNALQDAVGLDGVFGTATTLNQLSPNTVLDQSSGVSAQPFSISTIDYWIKKDLDETRFPQFVSDLTAARIVTSLNTKTGAAVHFSGIGVWTATVFDGGLWWVIQHTLQNDAITFHQINAQISPAKSDTLGGSGGHVAGSIVVGNVDVFLNSDANFLSLTHMWMPVFTTNVPVLRDADIEGVFSGVMDFYNDNGIWKAKEYIPERYRDEDGVLKNM